MKAVIAILALVASYTLAASIKGLKREAHNVDDEIAETGFIPATTNSVWHVLTKDDMELLDAYAVIRA